MKCFRYKKVLFNFLFLFGIWSIFLLQNCKLNIFLFFKFWFFINISQICILIPLYGFPFLLSIFGCLIQRTNCFETELTRFKFIVLTIFKFFIFNLILFYYLLINSFLLLLFVIWRKNILRSKVKVVQLLSIFVLFLKNSFQSFNNKFFCRISQGSFPPEFSDINLEQLYICQTAILISLFGWKRNYLFNTNNLILI